ncbi:uncharacterized protein K02A2.6-like [Anopheles arabiensis]|uniref:uncharacterized protein K02A2.6-like n=1 Tax=Anopheles arabiensis TaxID=7173 RepID=UPI001AACF524|nr:uncharacterized protein K02A2.6-like [Anopheles arabiensis]
MNTIDLFRFPGLTPQPFNYEGHRENLGNEWKKWIKSFEIMLRASRIDDEEWKKDLLLHFVGPKVQQIYETLPELPSIEKRGPLSNIEQYTPNMNSYEEAVAKLNNFFLPRQNPTYERHLLRQIKQQPGENFDTFIVKLRIQAERCGYGDKTEENIRDQIIENCQSAALRRELLRLGDANLDKILSVAKILETVAHQEKSFIGSQHQVDDVNKIDGYSVHKKRIFAETNQMQCHRCGYMGHLAKDEKCPAKGKTCSKCGGMNHFAKRCRTKNPEQRTFKGTKKYRREATEAGNREYKHDTVKHIDNNTTEYVFHLTPYDNSSEMCCKIGGIPINAMIDSGSKYNLISQIVWEQLKSQHVVVSNQHRDATITLKAYGGQVLPLVGVFTATVTLGSAETTADFYVVKGDGKTLIGRDTATLMGALKITVPVNTVDNENHKLSTLKNVVVDIPIKSGSVAVAQPYRRIPVALEKLVDKKLDELLIQGVIEQVNEPSKWVSPVVVVPKGNNDVRICVDMRRANEAVERENHPLPTFEDFLPHMAKAKVFSRLDIKNAFHQVEISKQSRGITTFITRRGLFRYTRLMFGINCAPELFQKTMEQILTGCEGCLNYIDDIIVYGSHRDEHDKRLTKVLQRLKEWNVVLNADKCVYGVSEMRILGHVISAEGVKPDKDKLNAIRNFRAPKSAEEVRSFLGLVNYVGKFIPDMATITHPLRQLTVEKEKFVWKSEHHSAFEKLKSFMISPSTLGFFDIGDRTQLIADASPVGLGAVLIQINSEGNPRVIAYASKSLSNTEKRYAQIEKEALALVWAVERFHFYLYGRQFELITDHKPLEKIFSTKSKPCARIERWVIRLQSYKASVIYRPGKSNIADPLSRLAITETVEGKPFDEFSEQYVAWIISNASPVALKLTEIEKASKADGTIQAVRQGIEKNE